MDDIGRLIHHAGARDTVSSERLEKARHRVGAHWEKVVAEQRHSRSRMPFYHVAVAASVLVAVGASFLLWRAVDVPPAIVSASIDRVLGEVMVADQPVSKGDVIGVDILIATGPDSRIALRMAGGQSLRIDTSSQLLVHSSNHVSLQSGGVYIDTDAASNPLPIMVSTPFGSSGGLRFTSCFRSGKSGIAEHRKFIEGFQFLAKNITAFYTKNI